LERYSLGRFQDRWDELLADLGGRLRHSDNGRLEEKILVPAREEDAMKISMISEHASPLAALGGVDAGGQNVHVAALSEALAKR
ncbi:hypothetical protein, partial [Pseudarthrobacter siccitolerans]